MNGPMFQEKIRKLCNRAGWESEDMLDFMSDFLHSHGLEAEFLESLQDEIEELDALADEIDGVLDESEDEDEIIEEGD